LCASRAAQILKFLDRDVLRLGDVEGVFSIVHLDTSEYDAAFDRLMKKSGPVDSRIDAKTRPSVAAPRGPALSNAPVSYFGMLREVCDDSLVGFLQSSISVDEAMRRGVASDGVPGNGREERALYLFFYAVLWFKGTDEAFGARILRYFFDKKIKVPKEKEAVFIQLLADLTPYKDAVAFIERWGAEFLISDLSVLKKARQLNGVMLSGKFFEAFGQNEAFKISVDKLKFMGEMVGVNDGDEKSLIEMCKAIGIEKIKSSSNLDIWAYYQYYRNRGTDGILENAREYLNNELLGIKDKCVLSDAGLFIDPAVFTALSLFGLKTEEGGKGEGELRKKLATLGVAEEIASLEARYGSKEVLTRLSSDELLAPLKTVSGLPAAVKGIDDVDGVMEVFSVLKLLSDADCVEKILAARNGFGGEKVDSKILISFLEFVFDDGLDLETVKFLSRILSVKASWVEEIQYIFEQKKSRDVILSLEDRKGEFLDVLCCDIDLVRGLSHFEFNREDLVLILDNDIPGKIVEAVCANFDRVSDALPYLCKLVTGTQESPTWDDLDAVALDDEHFGEVLKRCVSLDLPIEYARKLVFFKTSPIIPS